MDTPLARYASNPLQQLSFRAVLGVVVFCGSVTYFLKGHVLETQDQFALVGVGSYICASSYFVLHYFLSEYSTSYRTVSLDKQFYVLSNLIKGAILAGCTPLAIEVLYTSVWLDHWPATVIRNLGCVYCIPDAVSLFMVRRMARTTVFHHISVCVLCMFNIYNDYAEENVCRLVVVYAVFSTFAYLVNLLLASRFLDVSDGVSVALSVGASVIYGTCCAINWVWQGYYIHHLLAINMFDWSVYVYILLMLVLVWDDLVLQKWLCKNILKKSVPRGDERKGEGEGGEDKVHKK